MSPTHLPPPVCHYAVTVRGELGNQWTEWFADATITPTPTGDTVLTCAIPDQAALYGVLKKVRDLGLPLISVRLLPTDLNAG